MWKGARTNLIMHAWGKVYKNNATTSYFESVTVVI